jgi:hypothetical protein
MEALALFDSALTLAAIAKITPRLISTTMTTRAFSLVMVYSPFNLFVWLDGPFDRINDESPWRYARIGYL